MTEPTWPPLLRTPGSTVAKVLRSSAFRHSRERSIEVFDDAARLRALADEVEQLDQTDAPLSAVADHVVAALRLLRARADLLEGRPPRTSAAQAEPAVARSGTQLAPSTATRQHLVVAALLYLVERDDLVPDFRAGGYLDDVFAMAWVFGAAVAELAPYLDDVPPGDDLLADPTPPDA